MLFRSCLSPKFICDPQISSHGAFTAICGHCRVRGHPLHLFPATARGGDPLPSRFGPYSKQVSFMQSTVCHVLHILWVLPMTSLFKRKQLCVACLHHADAHGVTGAPVPKCCLVVLCALWRKHTCYVAFFREFSVELWCCWLGAQC